MDKYDAMTYGERVADLYDEWYKDYDENAITALSRLARGGRALELGIGTGRIAIPLQRKGVEVHGIDASPAMVTRLRAKEGGENLPVTFGNFADVAVEGQYALIYVMFNTFFALLTQDEQVRCFENVSRHLTAVGVFVIEAFVPDLTRFKRGQNLSVIQLDEDQVRFDATLHDPLRQLVTSHHVLLSENGTRLYPVKLRYVWPSEMDLMARLAGLRLQQRWGGWEGIEFTDDSTRHISVYARE